MKCEKFFYQRKNTLIPLCCKKGGKINATHFSRKAWFFMNVLFCDIINVLFWVVLFFSLSGTFLLKWKKSWLWFIVYGSWENWLKNWMVFSRKIMGFTVTWLVYAFFAKNFNFFHNKFFQKQNLDSRKTGFWDYFLIKCPPTPHLRTWFLVG